MSASPARLTVMLFEHLEVVMRRAQLAIGAGQVEQRVENLTKARAILSELLGTLNLDLGGQIAVELSMLYGFLLSELVDVGVRQDVERLGRLIGIVSTLGSGFAGAAQQVDAGVQPPVLAASA